MENKTKEQILDLHYVHGMHWKVVNRGNVLKAMEYFANQQTAPLLKRIEELEKLAEHYRRNVGRSGEDYLLEIERKNSHIDQLKEQITDLKDEVYELRNFKD